MTTFECEATKTNSAEMPKRTTHVFLQSKAQIEILSSECVHAHSESKVERTE